MVHMFGRVYGHVMNFIVCSQIAVGQTVVENPAFDGYPAFRTVPLFLNCNISIWYFAYTMMNPE